MCARFTGGSDMTEFGTYFHEASEEFDKAGSQNEQRVLLKGLAIAGSRLRKKYDSKDEYGVIQKMIEEDESALDEVVKNEQLHGETNTKYDAYTTNMKEILSDSKKTADLLDLEKKFQLWVKVSDPDYRKRVAPQIVELSQKLHLPQEMYTVDVAGNTADILEEYVPGHLKYRGR